MYSKLTLNIRRSVIEKAKKKAKQRKRSLSRLVEDYLENLSRSGSSSFVEDIVINAPKKKTRRGSEKVILKRNLKAKYDS